MFEDDCLIGKFNYKEKIMKNIALIIFVLLVCNFASAQSSDEMIKQAANAYKNEEYEKAVRIYKQILDKNIESPELYYNLGNSYYRLGKLGYAVLYFEKALKLDPDDEDTKYNLMISQARTIDKIQPLPQLWIWEWWDSVAASFSIYGWSAVVILFYILFLAAIGFYLITGNFRLRKISFYAGVLLIPVLILVSLMMISKINKETSVDYGVLTESIYTVKVTPGETANDAFVLHEGVKFSLGKSLDNWTEIKLADGKVGWIPESVFGKI